jgi:hypothetical protein
MSINNDIIIFTLLFRTLYCTIMKNCVHDIELSLKEKKEQCLMKKNFRKYRTTITTFDNLKVYQIAELIKKYLSSQFKGKTSYYWWWNFFSRALEYLQQRAIEENIIKTNQKPAIHRRAIKSSSIYSHFSRVLIKHHLFIILSLHYQIISCASTQYTHKSLAKEFFEVLRNKIERLAFSAISFFESTQSTTKDVKRIKTLAVD